ncbi:MAG: TonB C-terminal domain-containing protein [Cyanobacteria bacterium SZAS-4]|nr:TonB C-terminal domain-containing protein [Cyanobacteria bacterium SZAS-4]
MKCLTAVALICCANASTVFAQAYRSDLIIDMKSALASKKPIYDCACFNKLTRLIKRNWMPPKSHLNSIVVVSFKINEAGETTDVRLERSSGMTLSDTAAIKAIQNTKLDYVPLEHAKISFNFGYVLNSGIIGPSVVQIPDEAAPPVVYVRTMYESIPGVFRGGCLEMTVLNNQGIVELLKGHMAQAADLFEQSSHGAPDYEPAAHNLAIVRQQGSK